jgi:hypothetical protein
MSARITRNLIVERFGTPDETDGSLNDPVERAEYGIRYNEKWTYRHLPDDPAGAAQRIIYWHRYDFTGTLMKLPEDAEWRPDPGAERWAQGGDRLALVDDRHAAGSGNPHYRPASEVRDARDLGGYIEGEKN